MSKIDSNSRLCPLIFDFDQKKISYFKIILSSRIHSRTLQKFLRRITCRHSIAAPSMTSQDSLPIDLENNIIRIYLDEGSKRAFRVPDLAKKVVGEVVDDLLLNEAFPAHGTKEKAELIAVIVTSDGSASTESHSNHLSPPSDLCPRAGIAICGNFH